MTNKNKLAQLEAEVALLEAENARLERELYLAEEEEIYKTGKSYSYRCSKFFYRVVPLSMLSSAFYQKREIFAKKATACFMPHLLNKVIETAGHSLDYNPQLHFVMVCDQILCCGDGIMFMLSDPYRTIQTVPINTMTIDEAESFVGKVVLVKLIVSKDFSDTECFPLKAIKELNMPAKYSVNHEDWHILRQYISVSGNFECLNTIKNIEKELISKYPQSPGEKRKSVSKWIRDDEFRISTDNRIMCFCAKNGTILYADELRYPNGGNPFNNPTDGLLKYMPISEAYGVNAVYEDIIQSPSDSLLLLTGEEGPEIFK